MKMQVKRNPHYQAQAILARRDHSVFEVKQKLKRKNFTAAEIQDAIEFLQKRGLLNDEKFAALFCASKLRAKPIGPRLLRAQLQQRGVGESPIAAALQAAFPPGREAELAHEAAAAWRRAHPKHAEDKQRLFRFLASRGFSQSAYPLFDRRVRRE